MSTNLQISQLNAIAVSGAKFIDSPLLLSDQERIAFFSKLTLAPAPSTQAFKKLSFKSPFLRIKVSDSTLTTDTPLQDYKARFTMSRTCSSFASSGHDGLPSLSTSSQETRAQMTARKTTWPWVKTQIVPPSARFPIQPLKQALKWVVNSPTKMGSQNGFDHHSHYPLHRLEMDSRARRLVSLQVLEHQMPAPCQSSVSGEAAH